MTDASPEKEWYLARDGQQYGPLSDRELRKFVELGHLRPTDLLWRQGFPDWRPAAQVFPAAPAPAPHRDMQHRAAGARGRRSEAAASPAGRMHQGRGAEAASAQRATLAVPEAAVEEPLAEEDDPLEAPPRRAGRRAAIAAGLLVVAGAGGMLAAGQLSDLPRLDLLAWLAPAAELRPAPPVEALRALPFSGFAESTEALDRNFQQSALWQVLKQEFPEWYRERLEQTVRLKSGQQEDAAITKQLVEAVVALRRKHADEALAASPAALRTIAATFLDNLKHLAGHNVEACYGFISQGEASPRVLGLMNEPDHVQFLQRQITSVFEAIGEGKRSPLTQLPPRKSEYEALTQALRDRGWTDVDLQLFSDPKALARAKPQDVCRMVQDWFAAQLSIRDEGVQVRLLVESLKPVVAN